MAVKSILLKIARAVVVHVISQLAQQVRLIDDQVVNPMQVMGQQVTGGMWRGQGADAFVEAVNRMMVPDIQKMSGEIDRLGGNVRFALDRMTQADVKASNTFKQLGDVFAKIF
jgi:uncharacterized protein YukE